MDPVLKKYIEIFIVIFVLAFISYFVAYKFYLDDYCSSMSQNVEVHRDMNLNVLSDCRTSLFCEITNSSYNKWKIFKYDCAKIKRDVYEPDFYKEFFNLKKYYGE